MQIDFPALNVFIFKKSKTFEEKDPKKIGGKNFKRNVPIEIFI
jgi:hypothetical protein